MAIDKSNGPTQTNLIDKNVEIVTPEEMISDNNEALVEMTEDGGAEVDFDPSMDPGPGTANHDANLAEFIRFTRLQV